jgi:hypothetical protein
MFTVHGVPFRHSSQLAMNTSDSDHSRGDSSNSSDEESVAPATPLFPKASSSETVSARSYSKNPKRGNSKSLSGTIQLALLRAFEAGGGIEVFCGTRFGLAHLLDSDIATFGNRNSRLRTQVRSKVNQWKRLPRAEYIAILNSFSIVPFTQRQVPQAQDCMDLPGNRKRPPEPVKEPLAKKHFASPPTMSSNTAMKRSKNKATGLCLPVDPMEFDRGLASKYCRENSL